MAARNLEPVPNLLPVRHGMLCASGLTLESDLPTDAFDVVLGARGELTLILLALKRGGMGARESVSAALDAVRAPVVAGVPIYEAMSEIQAWTTRERGRVLALSLIRFSQADSRVEVLNAGMPAVACALPGGRVVRHPALSLAIGERSGEVHPYELCPLVWGSAWFGISKGASTTTESEIQRAASIEDELYRNGAELAVGPPSALTPWLERLSAGVHGRGDASIVLAHADPTRRFTSGIRP